MLEISNLASFKPVFSFYLFLWFKPMYLVLQLYVKVVLHNFVVYLLCTPFSPNPLTLIHTKMFLFSTLTMDVKKLYNCNTLFWNWMK